MSWADATGPEDVEIPFLSVHDRRVVGVGRATGGIIPCIGDTVVLGNLDDRGVADIRPWKVVGRRFYYERDGSLGLVQVNVEE